jgi:membrane associated rhomboid family serine protease
MNKESRKLYESLYVPFIIVLIMWAVWITEYLLDADFGVYGVMPRDVKGLIGILFAPFIHGDFEHLMSNTPAVLVLGGLMRFFYPSVSKVSMLLIFILSGIAVWIFARPSYHIGASGLVYGFAFFLFFSAVFRSDMRSLAISFFVILFYGGIVWGILPYQNGVSWETHLAGGIFGTVLAYFSRNADVPPVEILFDESSEQKSIPTYKEFKDEK